MKVVCITGGMGSGKTYVAKVFEALGYPVYYSDDKAKQMYFLPEIKKQVLELLGADAYINENEINKKFIASKIFSNKNLLSKVNTIIHTAIKQDFEKFIQLNKDKKIVFKESALIFEAGLQNSCDKIILITAPLELKIKRIQQRNSISKEEILNRLQHQSDDDQKKLNSHFIIVNDEKQPMIPQIVTILKQLKLYN